MRWEYGVRRNDRVCLVEGRFLRFFLSPMLFVVNAPGAVDENIERRVCRAIYLGINRQHRDRSK